LEDLVRKLFVLFLLGSLGLAVGCSGGGGGGQTPVGVPTGGQNNVLPIAVDGGPTATQSGGTIYENGLFASVTICAPGSTSNCVTVDHMLVDTGSVGVRVLQSEVASLNLPQIGGLFDCVQFGDGSFVWGPVENANVTLAGETASNIPIHIISSSTANIPSTCSGTNENTQSLLGANGILGVGLEPFDCGLGCDVNGGVSPIPPVYYTCPSSGCTPSYASCGSECSDSAGVQQVTNPVVLFSVDNNGVIVELPGLSSSGTAATVTGNLIIGIGTESNNQLTNANVFTVACADNFDTTFEGQPFDIDAPSCTSGATGGFIDSGSNALYFFDANNVLPPCAAGSVGSNFYCPPSLMSLSATNTAVDPTTGATGFTEITNFSVDNATNLFTANPTNAAFSNLAGPAASVSQGFDWGLPFFYGRFVYNAIDGQAVPSGLASPPWYAY
jgi:Protein of unknown function (DUF3443)